MVYYGVVFFNVDECLDVSSCEIEDEEWVCCGKKSERMKFCVNVYKFMVMEGVYECVLVVVTWNKFVKVGRKYGVAGKR